MSINTCFQDCLLSRGYGSKLVRLHCLTISDIRINLNPKYTVEVIIQYVRDSEETSANSTIDLRAFQYFHAVETRQPEERQVT